MKTNTNTKKEHPSMILAGIVGLGLGVVTYGVLEGSLWLATNHVYILCTVLAAIIMLPLSFYAFAKICEGY